MALVQGYLFTYNIVQAAGWAVCLYYVVLGLMQQHGYKDIYDQAAPFAKLFQALSFLEIVHAAAGWVKSSPLNNFMQWLGRSHAMFCICDAITTQHSSPFATGMIGCWALGEVIRYPWYALSGIDKCPQWLTWLRYSLFLPLYPVGVVCEMAAMVQALPHVQRTGMGSIRLPNAYNYGFDYAWFIKVVLALYPFLWFQLYYGLIRQRGKRLGSRAAAGAKKQQ